MADMFGEVVNVATANVGEFLTADVAAGASVLPVSDPHTFDEKGGQVLVAGQVLSYWGVDADNSQLLLNTSSGLLLTIARGAGGSGPASALLADERVEVYPLRPEKKALVDLGVDEGEAVFAIVPHSLTAVIPDGFREEGLRETVLVEERTVGELYVADMVAQPANVEVEITFGDGVPPIASPTPVVTGWVGALHAKWAAIIGSDFISYEVHISTINDFTPTPATLVGTTSGTSFTVRSLPDDALLAYNTTYYVKIISYDVDGPAPAGGQGSAQLVPITGPDVSASFVYAGELNAAQITGGEIQADLILSGSIATALTGGRTYMDSSGIVIYDPTGTPGTTLGPEQSVFVGDAVIGGLTVTDGASIRSTFNELSTGAELLLAAGITSPSTAPSIVQDWETITFTKPGDATFNPAGLTSVQKVGTQWVCGYKKAGTDEYYVYRFDAAGVYHSAGAHAIISSTVLQTTMLGVDGMCYSVASNNSILKHRQFFGYVHTFSDDFTSSISGASWPTLINTVWDSGAGGRAKMTGDDGPAGTMRTAFDKDMKDHFVSAKITRESGTSGQDFFMTVMDESTDNEMAQIRLEGSTLTFRQYEATTGSVENSTSITYNATSHAYWRIVERDSGAGGDFYFYTSADGEAWVNRFSHDHDFTIGELSDTQFRFTAQEDGSPGTLVVYVDEVRHGVNNDSTSVIYSTQNADGDTMTIGNDGTNILLAEHDNTGGDDRLSVRVIDPDDLSVISTFSSATVAEYDGPFCGILYGSFDLGANRYVFKRVGTLTSISPEWLVVNSSTGADVPAERFAADGGGSKSIAWDGTNFWALGSDGKIYKHTSLKHASGGATVSFAAGFTWFDSNATGGTHETQISPVASFTLKKRARLTLTAPSIPGAGGTDDPNSVRFYAGLTSGSLKLEATTGAGVNSAIFNSLAGSGAAPPGSNNFPGGTPAKIKSNAGGLIISGDGTISGGTFTGAIGVTEIGNAINLDSLTTSGKYSQTSDAEAAAGTNYPVPYAGFLEVDNASSIIKQTYTAYRNADSAAYPSVWTRMFASGAWLPWVPLFDDHGTESVVANFCVASTNFSITSGTVRLFAKQLSVRINWSRTTSTLAVPGDGNMTNTPICQMVAKYRPGTPSDQGGLTTGATGRGASYIMGPDGTITITWMDGGDTAGGQDILSGDTGSILGIVLMA